MSIKDYSDPEIFDSEIQDQPCGMYMITRLKYFSCCLFLTFIVCITQEFTFILNFTSFASTSSKFHDISFLRSTNASGFVGYFKTNQEDFLGKDDWRKVTEDIFIYSAFWDTRLQNHSFVRIIGGARLSGAELNLTKCLLKYKNSSIILETEVTHEILAEHHNKASRAIYFKCCVHDTGPPEYVTLVPMNWNQTWTTASWLLVHTIMNTTSLSEIGVCVRPMFNYSDTFRIAEFIAYYKAIGVSNFMFYDYEVTNDIIRFIYELTMMNYTIDILPWSLPNNLETMWCVGQIASINDCVYRQMSKVKYVVIVDLDEFVTPRHEMTLQAILNVHDIPKNKYASFVIRSSVFCSEYDQDVLPPVILPFLTQSSIQRENFIYPFRVRSKYILKPYFVEIAGVHFVWKFLYGFGEKFVPVSQVLLHHYRSKLCVTNKSLEKGEIDVKSRKYLNHLMRSKTFEVWRHMFKTDIT